MLLVGFLLFLLLLGEIAIGWIIPLFLVGIGVTLTLLALAKMKGPRSKYEMPPKAYLGYGILAIVVGVVSLTLSIELTTAEFVLAGVLVLLGAAFLFYSIARR
jgi:hypothetical protein